MAALLALAALGAALEAALEAAQEAALEAALEADLEAERRRVNLDIVGGGYIYSWEKIYKFNIYFQCVNLSLNLPDFPNLLNLPDFPNLLNLPNCVG